MLPRDSLCLEPFDTDVPQLPARSRLFALPPIGVGTENMEGLASYVTRLARAHSVAPWRLLRDEFDKDGHLRPFWELARYKITLDGLGRTAQIMSAIAMELTTVPEVRYLTLLPLSDLLPVNCTSLLAKEVRWCPRCLDAMIRHGQEPYRPLVWSFALYRACHVHKMPLVAACGQCGKKQKFLPDYPDLGHCGYCGSSLAERSNQARTTCAEPLDLWSASSIAHLVAHFPDLEGTPLRKQLAQFLGQAVNELAGGHRWRFCVTLGIHTPSIDKILRRDGRTRFLRLLTLAYGMNILPAAMLLPGGARPRTLRMVPPQLRREWKLEPLSEQRKKQIHEELVRIVADANDVRSGLAVSRALGTEAHRLIYWFPVEYSAICMRHLHMRKQAMLKRKASEREIVKEAVRRVASRGVFPSIRQVAKEVRPNRLVLARPDLMEAYYGMVREYTSAAECKLR